LTLFEDDKFSNYVALVTLLWLLLKQMAAARTCNILILRRGHLFVHSYQFVGMIINRKLL